MIWLGLILFAAAATPLAVLMGASGNWRASLLFIACILLVRIVFHISLNQPIIAMAVIYSGMAGLAFFFVDRFAGAFFAIVSLIVAAELAGFLPSHLRQIIGETVFCAGVICCVLIGPSGGVFKWGSPLDGRNRSADPVESHAVYQESPAQD